MSTHAQHLQRCLAAEEEPPAVNPLNPAHSATSATHSYERPERAVAVGLPAAERSAPRIAVAATEHTPDEPAAAPAKGKAKTKRKRAAPAGGGGLTEPKQSGKRPG